jgi:hypothetical protein
MPLPNSYTKILHTLVAMMLEKNQNLRASIDDILSVPEVSNIVHLNSYGNRLKKYKQTKSMIIAELSLNPPEISL